MSASRDPPDVSQKDATCINWKRCVLCHTITTDKLQCPGKSKRTDTDGGYKYILQKIWSSLMKLA